MKRVILLALAVLLTATPALAQYNSGSAYDWRTGNSYQWHKNMGSFTQVNGFNANTGIMWNQTIQPNGDQRGMDSQGNFWQYDNDSEFYWNANGTMCMARICN